MSCDCSFPFAEPSRAQDWTRWYIRASIQYTQSVIWSVGIGQSCKLPTRVTSSQGGNKPTHWSTAAALRSHARAESCSIRIPHLQQQQNSLRMRRLKTIQQTRFLALIVAC